MADYSRMTGILCCFVQLVASSVADAAERGLSSYLPGYYGDYAVAVEPKPGFYIYDTFYRYQAQNSGLETAARLRASALISGFQLVTTEKILNMTYAIGAYTAWIDADLVVQNKSATNLNSIRAHKFEHGDTSISPLILYWSSGNLHFNAYEAVFLPTGSFSAADVLNLSRNYFSFDSVLAVTWLDQHLGLEFSIVPGVLFNTRNESTQYRTGSEYHIDGMLNWYLNPTLAVGLHGYIYGQLEQDEIFGMKTSGLQSSSAAIGPSLLWLPNDLDAEGKVVIKWLHEVDSENRFLGDIYSLTGALKF